MGLAVRICVSPKLKQEEKIKARSRLKQICGHHIGQRYGQVLLRGTHTNIATDNAFIRLVQAMLGSQKADLRSLIEQGLVVRSGEPRHIALREGTYRGLTAGALADARVGQMAEESARLEQRAQDLERQIDRAERDLRQCEQAWQAERDRLLLQIEQLEQEVLVSQGLQEEQEEKDRTYFTAQAQIRAKAQKELDQLAAEERRLSAERTTSVRQQEQDARKWDAATKELKEVRAMGWWKRTFSQWRTYDEAVQAALIEEHRQDWVEEGQKIASMDEALTANRLKQMGSQATLAHSEQEERARRDHIRQFPSPHVKKIKQIEQQLAQRRRAFEEGEQPVARLKAQIEAATTERARIEAHLSDIKAEQESQRARIIAEAQLIATTVTSIYLNPRLLEREFDVVVVDELSMISVIGVLLVVSRALQHVVGAGDPMQLPPVVVLRHEEQAPLAREWLGKDLFSHLGISIFEAVGGAKECVLLTEQGRSNPAIIAPINHYVYQDMLTSRAETMHAPAIGPHPEWPLMLVDTTGSKAKCVKPSRDKPRENTYHARLAVTIAQQVLTSLPPCGIPELVTLVPSLVTLVDKFSDAALFLLTPP